jgi:hypothetical protein
VLIRRVEEKIKVMSRASSYVGGQSSMASEPVSEM